MAQQKMVKIRVLRQDSQNPSKFRELFRNSVFLAVGIAFDYDLIERSLSLMFPDSLIEFTVSVYEQAYKSI